MPSDERPAHYKADLARVTDLLYESGMQSFKWVKKEHLDRGTAVHKATQYHDEGTLRPNTLDPRVAIRLAQYQRFLRETKAEIHEIEQYVRHPLYGYQGTLDRVLTIYGRRGVLDIKGTAESPWHGIQLALYAMCYKGPLARWNLYLYDQRYRLVERKDWGDYQMAKAILLCADWRRTHNLIEEGHD